MTRARRSAERLLCYSGAGILLLLVLWFAAPLVWRYFSPFLIALPIAAMLQPLTRLLEEKLRFKHGAAVLVPVILLCAVLVGLVIWFGSFGLNQLTDIFNNSGSIIREQVAVLRNAVNSLNERILALSGGRIHIGSMEDDAVTGWLTERAAEIGRNVLSALPGTAASLPFIFVYLNILVFSVYFLSRDYARIKAAVHRWKFSDPDSDTGKLTHSALVGIVGWLRVQGVYALLSFAVGSIYWKIMGNPYAILTALAASILEFLPIVGNGTIYYPWAVIALLEGNVASAIQALALFYGLLLIRRMTEPKLLSHHIGISPLLSLVSMFVGLRAGGLLGMVLSPAMAALAVTFWNGAYRQTMHEDIVVLGQWVRERWGKVEEDTPNCTEDQSTEMKKKQAE